jgi:tellurite methyltransferase
LTKIEEWDQRYRAGEQLSATPAPLVVEFTSALVPGSALDLASGPGRNALYLAERGWRVTAVDGSPVAIELLRGRDPSIDAQLADLETGEFEIPPQGFDLVLSCYYFQRSLIPAMQSALRPGGLLIMIVRLADVGQPQGTPTRAYPGELRAFFDGWRVLRYWEGDRGASDHRLAVAEVVVQKPA